MATTFAPFVEGPTRSKQVLSLGFYRTGSHSLKEALAILGYRDVFHSSAIATDLDKWPGLAAAADANISCLPTYNGRSYSRADWDAYFGPCEALTDVTPFSDSLIQAYPEARVILVKRDFESWSESFLQTLILPSSTGVLAWLSGHWMEPVLGIYISQSAWKMYMGILGVCDMRKVRDRTVMRAAYDRHHDAIRRMVPPDRLLELDLKDLNWKPLCEFLGKEVPGTPFPRLNESKVFRSEFRRLHLLALQGAFLKVGVPIIIAGLAVAGGLWWAQM